jgi:hypothetical protein
MPNPNDANSSFTTTGDPLLSAIQQHELWHSWKQVSLVNRSCETLDLILDNEDTILPFLHVLHKQILQQSNSQFLREYKILKVRHKLQHEAASQRLSISHLFQIAIFKTIL